MGAGEARFVLYLGNAQIGEYRCAIIAQQNVTRFDVAVDDAGLVSNS